MAAYISLTTRCLPSSFPAQDCTFSRKEESSHAWASSCYTAVTRSLITALRLYGRKCDGFLHQFQNPTFCLLIKHPMSRIQEPSPQSSGLEWSSRNNWSGLLKGLLPAQNKSGDHYCTDLQPLQKAIPSSCQLVIDWSIFDKIVKGRKYGSSSSSSCCTRG